MYSDAGTLSRPSVLQALRGILAEQREKKPWTAHAVDLYHDGMEVQVNIKSAGGQPVYDSSANARPGRYSFDNEFGIYEAAPFRIPYGAATDNATWSDRDMNFPLHLHWEAIGLTGWDFKAKRSRWWGYDFDAITGHAAGIGITAEALAVVRERAMALDYAEPSLSTGGLGLHIRVHNPYDIEVRNHKEHAALARVYLQRMSRDAGFDFSAQVDVYGGVLWSAHATKTTEANQGLKRLKEADPAKTPPPPDNWRDHLPVVEGKRTKVLVRGADVSFESMAASQKTPIEESHTLAMDRLNQLGFSTVWHGDHNCVQTHTAGFTALQEEFPDDYKGAYFTLSEGNNPGEPNCFAFPQSNGAWKVVRFTRGAREHVSWEQDGEGWTSTTFNVAPTLRSAALVAGAAHDDQKDTYVFNTLEGVNSVAAQFGGEVQIEPLKVLANLNDRQFSMRTTDDGWLVAQVERKGSDPKLDGWVKKPGLWERSLGVRAAVDSPTANVDLDSSFRFRKNPEQAEMGWVWNDASQQWVEGKPSNLKLLLASRGHTSRQADRLMGKAIENAWTHVSIPFGPEYPGNRQWNRNSPQFAYQPAPFPGPHPTWDMVFNHTGRGLDWRVTQDPWCQKHGIKSGADYLRLWLAAAFYRPYGHNPYLFFWGPHNSGKSTFHEAMIMLLRNEVGYLLADKYVSGTEHFNVAFENAVLCVVEETNMSGQKNYDRIKPLITGPKIMVRAMHVAPYAVPNTTSWVQTANYQEYGPQDRDGVDKTRITAGMVPEIPEAQELAKDTELMPRLRNEASYFMRTLRDIVIPPSPGRLLLPPLGYPQAAGSFFKDELVAGDTYKVTIPYLYEEYTRFCDAAQIPVALRVGKNKVKTAIQDAGFAFTMSKAAYEGDDSGDRKAAYVGFTLKSLLT